MRALVLHGAKDLRVEEQVEPPAPGPGEVLVAIERGGICGTDLHYFQDGGFGTVRLREPMILGHEVSGRIAALGAGAATGSAPRGHRSYGSAMPMPHIQGPFRELIVADAGNCIDATGLTAAEAAKAEPLSVCLHATRLAGEMVGRRVLVTGCGPIGLLAILCARRAGAGEIVATDIADFPLTLARKVDADRTVNVATDGAAMEGYGADKGYFNVHYECAGAPTALASGIAAMAPRGTIVQLGLGGDMNVPLQTLTTKELSVRGSFRFHEEFAVAVALMQKGLIDVKPLITHTLPFADALAGFALAADRRQAMKVQLQFSA